MKRFSTLHLPVMSFFSKRIYRDVALNWKGSNLGYLFIVLAVCWIAPTVNMRDKLVRKIEVEKTGLIAQIPDIQIKNGIVSANVKQPYHLKKNGVTIAIIDTTGSLNYIDDDNVVALLTETEFIFRNGRHFNTLELDQIRNLEINQSLINSWLDTTTTTLTPGFYGVVLLLSFVAASVVLVLYALIGKIFAVLIHTPLKLGAVLRISVAATTPALLIFAISSAWNLPTSGLIYAIITFIYLFLGISACANAGQEKRTVNLLSLIS